MKAEEITRELFGTTERLTELQADVYRVVSVKMLKGDTPNPSGEGRMREASLASSVDMDFTLKQLKMMVANDAGMVAALGMGGGKTIIYPTVIGRQMQLGISQNNMGEIIVSSKQEIQNAMDNAKYMEQMYGVKLLNGGELHKEGTLADVLKAYKASGERVIVVFDLETRGHLSHEMRTNKALSVLGDIPILAIDEADVMTLKSQSFINAERIPASIAIKQQAAMILELYDKLSKRLNKEYEYDPARGLELDKELTEAMVNELRKEQVFKDALWNPNFIGKIDAKKADGQISFLIQQVLRARAEVINGTTIGGFKADAVTGIQVGVKDGVDINSVASQIFEPFYREHKVADMPFTESFTVQKFERQMHCALEQFAAEVSKTTVEASTQEIVTRNKGIQLMVFGGSGTTWGAQRISQAVTASVAELAEAGYGDYAYVTTKLGARVTQEVRAAEFANRVMRLDGWGGLVIQEQSSLRKNVLATLKAKASGLPEGSPHRAVLEKLMQNIIIQKYK